MESEPDNTNHDIPLEICIQILSYLPVKLLLRFRSVSKEWKSIIDSPDFASFHLSRYPNNSLESHLLVLEKNTENHELRAQLLSTCTENEYSKQVLEFNSPGSAGPFSLGHVSDTRRIVGECDGLLLLLKTYGGTGRWWSTGHVMLWNPSIRKSLDIPHPPSLSGRFPPTSYFPLDLCLGFDPSTNDYKLVNVIHYYKKAITCEIFSLNSRTWRSGKTPSPNGDDEIHLGLSGSNSKKVFAGGYVHWVARGEGTDNETFVSFSMISETLSSSTPLPISTSCDTLDARMETPIILAGSMVGLLRTSCFEVNDIWALQTDGCWSKLYTLPFNYKSSNLVPPSYHLRNDGVLVMGRNITSIRGVILAYDTTTKKLTVIEDSQFWPFYIGTYVESLALLR